MAPMDPWLWGRRTESATAKDILENMTGITRIPHSKDGVEATYLKVKPFMMNAYSDDKQGAWKLIQYIQKRLVEGLTAGAVKE